MAEISAGVQCSSTIQMTKECFAYLRASYINEKSCEAYGRDVCANRWEELTRRLTVPPMYTTLRANTLCCTKEQILEEVETVLQQESSEREKLHIETHPKIPDAIIIKNTGPYNHPREPAEVIVGLLCGMAVMRGAHVFAQGIMGAPAELAVGTSVSVYADINNTCRKGQIKSFTGHKLFVGNGIMQMSRQHLFCSDKPPSGLAVKMTHPVYQAPSLSDVLPHLIFAQNLPSMLCSHVLGPEPGELLLDMCAAPGGKTTHLATLMRNKGHIVAFDKGGRKVAKIVENADKWGITIIKAFSFDARKAYNEAASISETLEPPFPAETFDRILVDAPCSSLGQRPCLKVNASINDLKGYPSYQKKIIAQAVPLLKAGGVMVYSTCTVTLEENENQVAWILKHFPEMKLVQQTPYLGGPALKGSSLTEKEESLVQRFDPSVGQLDEPHKDTIGFFIAKFVKSVVKR